MQMHPESEPQSERTDTLPPREQWTPAAHKLRDNYAAKPGAPFHQREFWLMPETLKAWHSQGMPEDADPTELFGFDPPGHHPLQGLGWTTAAFDPPFPEKILQDRGEHELVQDEAGRGVLCFKGRRSGFMPHYETHPVHDQASWEEQCLWRLDPDTPARRKKLEDRMQEAHEAAARGLMISQRLIGGYMYLRSLMGPEGLLYKFYEDPELIHACMQQWLTLSDTVIARHQQHITLDEIFLAEDICFNGGPLISPDMMREFLLPYYRQLLANVRARQRDASRHLYVQIDTDGDPRLTIPLYRELGMDVMSPFEVASGCDVLAIGHEHPWLVMTGGLDKRVLARDTDAIDRMIDNILPRMQERGGYIPTIDHGVPEEVPYENYLHFRRRCLEFG